MADLDAIKRPKLLDTSKVPDPVLGDAPLTGERYYSKEYMQKEWDKLWTKTWLIAGLDAQIPKVGDFITAKIGIESIICVRGKDKKVRAFYNVCPHRGNRLIDDASGNKKAIACRYHGWRFDLDGDLKLAPCAEDFPQGNPCGKLKLSEIPCEVWSGFIWYSLDENALPLAEHLGPIKHQVESYQMDNMKRIHWTTVEGDFNWKIPQDNFNESYHLPFVHPQAKYSLEQSYEHCQFDMYEGLGHTRMQMPGDRPSEALKGEIDTIMEAMHNQLKFWELDPEEFRDNPLKMRAALQKAKRERGAEKGFDYSGFVDDQLTDHFHYILFPNLSLSLKPDGCIFTQSNPHPTDPTKSYFDFWYLIWFPKDHEEYYCYVMSETFKADFQPEHVQGPWPEASCGPAIDQDVEVWNSQQLGLQSRGFKREYLSGQESRVRFWHETLDHMLES